MKTLFRTLLIFAVIASGCSEESDTVSGDVSITGKWQRIESYVSPGGETQWKTVKDGRIYNFKTDSTFTSNGPECPEGTFSVNSDTLRLEFHCNYEETPRAMKFYFEGGDLFLTPVSPACVETCLYKYERID